MGDPNGCIDTLVTAYNLFKDLGLAVGNPFFHLRLGQASLQVEPTSIDDHASQAVDNLARALVCGGIEIFAGEEPAYLAHMTHIMRIPAGHSSWADARGYGCSVDKLAGATG